jgi:hypothetical protein
MLPRPADADEFFAHGNEFLDSTNREA